MVDSGVAVPTGAIDEGFKKRLQQSLTAIVPEDKTFVVALVVDPFTAKPSGKAQVGVRIGKDFVFGTELERDWAGHVSGQVMLTWSK